MRKIKEILRLRLLGGITGARRIGLAVGCGKSAVAECLRRATAAGLAHWAAVEALDETALEQRLYPAQSGRRRRDQFAPDYVLLQPDARVAARDLGQRPQPVHAGARGAFGLRQRPSRSSACRWMLATWRETPPACASGVPTRYPIGKE
jgi:hypothetical protein